MTRVRAKGSLRKTIGLLAATAMLLLLAACGSGGANGGGTGDAEDRPVRAVATIGMITDIVSEVGGTHVEAEGIMKAGVDPHLYKARQSDIAKLENADIVFYNGLHLEGKMADILEKMGEEKPAVPVSERIPESSLLAGDAGQGTQYDPHIWFDVANWMLAVEVVRDALIELDGSHADAYRANADAYLKKLEELDRYASEQIAAIPERQRVLVTAHDAFGYFGRAYGIEVRGLQGISTASEAGTKDVTELRDYLAERGIKAVFVESSVSPKAIEAVIQGAAKKGHTIRIGGELYSDAMGEAGTPEGTYIGMVRHNVDTIVEALK